MNRKMVRGSIIFIALVGLTAVFLLVQHKIAERQQFKKDVAESDKVTEQHNQQKQQKQPVSDNGPPPTEPGFKWVRHGEHWDKVPISEPHQHSTQEVPMTTYDGPLTYHKELLEKHPVEALYQQTLERGHWSARHIPPFPLDDQEAATYARINYLKNYYRSIGQTDTPKYQKLLEESQAMLHFIHSIEDDDRWMDLKRFNVGKSF